MSSVPRPARWLFITAAVVLIADRLSKALIQQFLEPSDSIQVIPGVLHITHTTNTGGAFGLFQNVPWLFAIASIGVSVAIIVGASKVPRTSTAVALGLILGGALGNLVDRLAGGIDFSGHVVDFIDFRIWPVFNLADSAIVIGVVLLIFQQLTSRDEETPAAASTDDANGHD